MNHSADLPSLLAESRRREKAQTRYYRALAAVAEDRGDASQAERLNALHADEQHHLSRLTARLLELGFTPEDLSGAAPAPAVYEGWEEEARRRESREIEWYEGIVDRVTDDATRSVLAEILESEHHHRQELGGKWMPA